MSYTLHRLQEKGFLPKVITGRLRQVLPPVLYNLILEARYLLFSSRCRNLALPTLHYSDGAWVTRKTTADLLRIQAFLLEQPGSLAVFQAGIGNSSLYKVLKDKVSRLVGVTIAEEEVAYAAQQWPEAFGKTYQAQVTNKYTADIAALGRDFDYIVDNDLSSFACCHYHFEAMLDAYRNMLKPTGAILVGFLGLGYFDNGFGLTEKRMAALAARHGLEFSRGAACYFLKPQRKAA